MAGVLLSVLWLALALHGAWVKAATYDEVAHIGDGLAIWRYGDFRMNPEHPPLFKVLAVLPVELFARPDLTLERNGRVLGPWVDGRQYEWGHYALFLSGGDGPRMVFLARIFPILFGLLGGWIAWMWAARFGGRRAGLFAMTLLLFYPEYLGHARFVTLDVPTLVACGIISLLAWRAWKRPTPLRLVLFVLVSSLLTLVKLPVLIALLALWLCFPVMLALRSLARPSIQPLPASGRFSWRHYLLASLAFLLFGYILQWAIAGFRFSLDSGILPMTGNHRLLDFPNYPDGFLAEAIRWIHRNHLLPETSICVLAHLLTIGGRHMFLFGEMQLGGWYHYYLVSTIVKTPIVYLVGLPVIVYVYTRQFVRGRGLQRERLAVLLVPVLVLLAMSVHSRLNIGHRHVLFVYLPWCVLMGAVLARVSLLRGPLANLSGIAALVAVTVCLYVHPHQATYFNVLGGGNARNGWRILRDSNIDWGQDIGLAARKCRDIGFNEVNLAYFGSARPEAYGLSNYHFILPDYPHAIYMPEGVPPDPDLPSVVSLHVLDDVRRLYPGHYDREPDAIANSIVVFDSLSAHLAAY